MQSVAVFCGSRAGNAPAYAEAAVEVGRKIAERGLTLVYGGSQSGLMGLLADAALEGGAKVVGVLPHMLADRERAHPRLTELVLVDTLAERKHQMAERADAFIAMPGGFGTLDELFEMVTWTQLRLQRKPVGIANVDGYFDHLMAFIYWQVEQGFVVQEHLDALVDESDAEQLLNQLERACRRISVV